MNRLVDNKTQEGSNLDGKFEVASSLFGKGGLLEPKDEWDKLSMAAKAEMMRVAVNHGIYDLATIRQKYNEFAKGGKKENEQYYSTMEKVAEDNYKDWGFSNSDEALVHVLNDNTYNYRDFYRKYPWSEANATTHWTDEFKTVYHPTFSNESIYSGQKSQYNPQGLTGGFWVDDSFFPSIWQLDNNEYSKGGGIHIKHPGRLTALKKRTGKTEAELYNDGNPAHKKMVVFARNARRWKHGEGGNLFAEAGQLGHPYYEYDDNGNLILGADGKPLLTYNAKTPLREVVITGRKNKGFLEEALDRFKDINLAYIDNPAVMTAAGQTAKMSGTHYPTKGEQQLGENLAIIGEAGLTAPTLTGDIKATYQAVRHPVQTAKAVKEGIANAYHGIKDIIKGYSNIGDKAFASEPLTVGDIMSKMKKDAEIAKYANSQKNPVLQLEERMSDAEYAAKIKANSNPIFTSNEKPIYVEGYNPKDPNTYQNIVKQAEEWWKTHRTAADGLDIINEGIIPGIKSGPFAAGPSPYAYIPEKGFLFNHPMFRESAKQGAAKDLAYQIIKSHEGSHIYSSPIIDSPLSSHLKGKTDLISTYFKRKNGSELSARGSQLKSYFGKKSISEDELKYAAEHYSNDTGVDNNMSDMFSAIKEAAKSNPKIWKEMAKWFSEVSPVVGSTIYMTKE